MSETRDARSGPAAPVAVMRGAPPPERAQATLANWRESPFSEWAFNHVREIVPSAEIATGPVWELGEDRADLSAVPLPAGDGEAPLSAILSATATAGLVVLQGGRLVWEWYDRGHDGMRPHILFSVSKSVTGLVAGILADRGLLDPSAAVTDYVPEVEGSAYDGATVTDLLDMTVSTAFDESYLNADGDFARYRVSTAWNPDPAPGGSPQLRAFLATLPKADAPHGRAMHYVSPNSDLLGWVIERAGRARFADLAGDLLWAPMGAEAPAEITVDRLGAPRTAGGISARTRDLARLGELVRRRGIGPGGRPVLPGWWIDDMWSGGDRQAWLDGDMTELFPEGRYRSKWYQTGHASGALAAVGIHGQWLWIDPDAEVVIAKASAQPVPSDDDADQRVIAAFAALADALG